MVKRQTHSNAPLEFDCWMRTNKWKNIFQIFLREAYKLRRQHRKCEWTQPKISERIGWKLTFTSENTDFCVVWTDSGSCRCYYSDGFWVCWILFPLIMQSMMCAVREGRYIMAFTHTRTHARTHTHTHHGKAGVCEYIMAWWSCTVICTRTLPHYHHYADISEGIALLGERQTPQKCFI